MTERWRHMSVRRLSLSLVCGLEGICNSSKELVPVEGMRGLMSTPVVAARTPVPATAPRASETWFEF